MPSVYDYSEIEIQEPFPIPDAPSPMQQRLGVLYSPYILVLGVFAYLAWTQPKILRIKSLRKESPVVAAFKFK